MVQISLKENEVLFLRDVLAAQNWKTPFMKNLASDIEMKLKKASG